MTKKKHIFLIAGCVLAGIVFFRESGILDINLYGSVISSSNKLTKKLTTPGKETRFSYNLTIKHGNGIIASHCHIYNSLAPIEIMAIISEPVVYSGNYYWPLVKDFKMKYQCEFTSSKAQTGFIVAGNINGEVNARISGFCSRNKAKALALEEARKQIVISLQNSL